MGGYIRVNEVGDIVSLAGTSFANGILIADDVLFNDICQNTANYKWLDDKLIKTERPSVYHSWSGTGWLLDSHALQEAKSAMWQEIKAYRDARQLSGFRLGNNWFHSDDSSRIKYLGLMMMGANIPQNLTWKTMQNTFVPMTQALATQIFGTIASFDSATFIKAERHKAAMQASSDPLNYDYSADWPPIFGE